MPRQAQPGLNDSEIISHARVPIIHSTASPRARGNVMKLSVVIPVYNEAATILATVERVRQTPYNQEIIVVDDGSTDGTRDVLSAISDPTVRVFFHSRNRGKGAALRTGFALATGDYVLVQDADLEYDPNDYEGLLEPLLKG